MCRVWLTVAARGGLGDLLTPVIDMPGAILRASVIALTAHAGERDAPWLAAVITDSTWSRRGDASSEGASTVTP